MIDSSNTAPMTQNPCYVQPFSEVFNEDCIQVMKRYPDKFFDLAVVDPPYGLADKLTQGGTWASKYAKGDASWDIAPPKEYWDELFRVSKNQIVWGGNYFGLPPNRCFIIWDKVAHMDTLADCEYAWTSFDRNAKIFKHVRNTSETRIHICQKPIKLYEWIYKNFAVEGNLILDTHLGSGSSRIAANKAGLAFVGIEISPAYFEAQEARFKDIPDVSGIYIFKNTINGKCYIGQSVNIRLRFAEHRRKRNLRTNLPLYRAVVKYGWDAFTFQILEVIDNSADLQDRECFWISFFRSSEKKFGYNICTEPHRSTLGRKRPEAECVAISDHAKTRVGELNPFFGKSHSAETKRKISEANKGAKRSIEHISKLHQAAWAASSKKVVQRCKKSGEVIKVWDSCSAASRGTGVSISSISQCARGKTVSKKFGWEYI